MLQLFRDDYQINDNSYIPFKYVRVFVSAYYCSTAQGYIPVTGDEKDHGINYCDVGDGQGIWQSSGRHSWEDAESEALDYIIKKMK